MKKIELSVKKLLEIDGEQKYQTINLFEVLDDSQRTETIVIADDVVLKNGKKQPLPKFYNITLTSGTLDCGDFVLSKESILPDGVDVLICKHSIQGLGDLIDILPQGIKKVYVRNKIFNDLSDENKHDAAKDFVKKYPDVIVYDERGQTLDKKLEVLAKIEKQEKKQLDQNQKTLTKAATGIRLLNKEDVKFTPFVKEYLKNNGINDDEEIRKLEVRVKESLSIKGIIQKGFDDKNQVNCFNKANEAEVIAALDQALENPGETHESQKEVVETNSSKTQRNKASRDYNKNKGSKQNNNSEKGEIKTIEIKKLVPENLIDNLKGGEYTNYLKAFIEIAKMNISPNRLYGPNENKEAVYYINENNTKCALKGVKKEGSIICQALPDENGRGNTRLYWYFLNVKPENQTKEIAILIFLAENRHGKKLGYHNATTIRMLNENLKYASLSSDGKFTYKFPGNTNETTIYLNENECRDINCLNSSQNISSSDKDKLGGNSDKTDSSLNTSEERESISVLESAQNIPFSNFVEISNNSGNVISYKTEYSLNTSEGTAVEGKGVGAKTQGDSDVVNKYNSLGKTIKQSQNGKKK